eukprot:SAG31_NODE_3821_length_3852_cov_4.553424_3_plen_58_part_00
MAFFVLMPLGCALSAYLRHFHKVFNYVFVVFNLTAMLIAIKGEPASLPSFASAFARR